MNIKEQKIVIVGANQAGCRAAEALRNKGFEGRITLVGEEPYLPYDRPPLSKDVLKGDLSKVDNILLHKAAFYQEHKIDLLLSHTVERIDVNEKVITANNSEIAWDKLILATGGRARKLTLPGSDLDGVFTLRTFDDAGVLNKELIPGRSIVIVGGGVIGTEIAAVATELGCKVTIVEMESALLLRALGGIVSPYLTEYHQAHGVEIMLNSSVQAFQGERQVSSVLLSDGSQIEADAVLVGVGIIPNCELAAEAYLACDGGILVNELCETSASDVYAIGDVARQYNPFYDANVRIESIHNAQRQAVVAAESILGNRDVEFDVPWVWSDQYDLNIQICGDPGRSDDWIFRGDPSSKKFVVMGMIGDEINAVIGINSARDMASIRRIMKAGVSASREFLADEGSELRSLLSVA